MSVKLPSSGRSLLAGDGFVSSTDQAAPWCSLITLRSSIDIRGWTKVQPHIDHGLQARSYIRT
jgi:hypothetical protein